MRRYAGPINAEQTALLDAALFALCNTPDGGVIVGLRFWHAPRTVANRIYAAVLCSRGSDSIAKQRQLESIGFSEHCTPALAQFTRYFSDNTKHASCMRALRYKIARSIWSCQLVLRRQAGYIRLMTRTRAAQLRSQ